MQTKEEILTICTFKRGTNFINTEIALKAMEQYALEQKIELLDMVNQKFFIHKTEHAEFEQLRKSLTKQLTEPNKGA